MDGARRIYAAPRFVFVENSDKHTGLILLSTLPINFSPDRF